MKQEQGISTLSLAILGVIHQQPQTGYDIRKLFSTTPLGHFSNSPGAIYPALKRIEDAGWIRGRTRQGKTRRNGWSTRSPRKGLGVLTEHLSQPVTQDDVTWRMDDLMLRFAFMDPVIGREATLRVPASSSHRRSKPTWRDCVGISTACGTSCRRAADWPWRTASRATR